MQITFFFRKQRDHYHSIERVFNRIIDLLPNDVDKHVYYLKTGDKGIFYRLSAFFEVLLKKGRINHITGDITYLALALPRKGLIVTFHDLESLDRGKGFRSFILKYFWVVIPARRAQIITVISEHTKQKVIEWSCVDDSKIRVIHNPLPEGFSFSPKPFNANKPNILCVGTKANKNLEGIIEAVKTLACRLIIVGKLTNDQLGLLSLYDIDYSNYEGLSDKQIIERYIESDILCFPSFFEGFGMPIIEAQTMGRPVLTSNRGAMKEVSGKGALLVNPDQPQEITDAIKIITDSETLRRELVEKGRINALKFQAETVVKEYLRLYEELIG